MKNTLKYLSILAASGSFLLGSMNVNAAKTCEAGETEHTDYIMMLDARDADELKAEIDKVFANNGNYTQLNGADKFNNIKGKTIIETGDVKITMGSKATTPGNATKTWTVVEYWQKYYTAAKGQDSNYAYNDPNGTDSYLMHDKWTRYKENFTEAESRNPTASLGTTRQGLLNFLESNRGSLSESSDFIRKGTVLPTSTIIPPTQLESYTGEFMHWQISRVFDHATDKVDGVDMNSDGKNTIFAPAAFFVTYCVPGSGTTPDNSKTIKYDGNGEGSSNVPADNTFKDKCTTISNQRPTREGYTFLGWSASPTASEPNAKYAPGAEYCEGNITLYAIWKKNETNTNGTYTVTYDANGGKNAPASDTKNLGTCATISSNKPTLTGNKFLGWSSVKDAKEPEAKYAAGSSYCEDKNITLYAVWQPVTGISAHMIAFGVVAIAAGAALIVAKKKDLFRQI